MRSPIPIGGDVNVAQAVELASCTARLEAYRDIEDLW